MSADQPTSKSALAAVRGYIRLLVATILILSFSLIAYLSWRDHLSDQLEEVATYYHLETILYCTQVKEEMSHILPPQADGQNYAQRSEGQGRSQRDYAVAVYLLEKYTQAISQLHGAYGALSDQSTRFEPIIRKASRQLARIKAVLGEAGATGMSPFAESEAPLLGSFTHSIEQLPPRLRLWNEQRKEESRNG